MHRPCIATAVLLAVPVFAAAPLPGLRVEPIAGGSVFYLHNTSSQPLTAYLVELVDYPGSSYSLWQDDIDAPVAPGAEKRIQVANMTVGAVPDYVKIQAALYADGSSSGVPEKVAQLVDRRRATLAAARELIARMEKTRSANAPKNALIADLQQWADSLQPRAKGSPPPARGLILNTIARLQNHSLEDELNTLRSYEKTLAASKPPL